MEEKENRKKEAAILFTRVGLSVALLLLGTLYLNEDNFPWYANLIVMLSSYLIIAYDVIFKAFRLTFAEKDPFNECTLMVLASFGAFALRAFGKGENEYLEGVLVILLYQIGEFFQDLAEDKSKDAITKAIDLREEKAKVRLDGKLIEKDAEDIQKEELRIQRSSYNLLLEKDRRKYIRSLEKEMRECADRLEFEKAATIRDEIERVKAGRFITE